MFILIKIAYIFIFLTILISCQNDKDINSDTNIKQEYQINIEEEYPIMKLHIQKVIPLETKSESVIGRGRKLIDFKGNYFVMDILSRDVKMFDSAGQYIKTIGNQGKGPHEYMTLTDIQINQWTQSLDMLDPRGKLVRYKLGNLDNDDYLDDILFPEIGQISHFKWLTENDIVLNSIYLPFMVRFYNAEYTKYTNTTLKSNMPNLNRTPNFGCSPFLQQQDQILYFDYNNSNSYLIQNRDLAPGFSLNFGKNNFSYEELSSVNDQFDFMKYKIDHDKAFPVFNIFINDEYMGLGVLYHEAIHYFLRRKSDGKTYRLDIPIYRNNFLDFEAFANGLHFDTFRGIILNPAEANIILVGAENRDEFKELLNTANEIDNPWIVKYEVVE